MQFVNETKLLAGYTMAVKPDGRELIVVAAKATYRFPDRPEKEPLPSEEQEPLVETDTFTGEPGFSAPLCEIDYAPRKPRCDVILNGSAYAPDGKARDRVTVSLRVGAVHKSFDVVGNRAWKRGMMAVTATEPKPFTIMPISYDNAFGGIDRSQEDPALHRWFPGNHAGVGYHEYFDRESFEGKPLPNTEETGVPVITPNRAYRPMAFGPVGRSWHPRIKWAGTYDQKWLDEKYPFLPDDFDERHYQCAPEDQWTEYPQGGEVVELTNLTPRGKTTFRLPKTSEISVLFLHRAGKITEIKAVIDTLVIEPDRERFMMTWRASCPIARTIREFERIIVGRTARSWERQKTRERRIAGKRRFASLREMVSSSRKSTNV